MGKKKNKKQLNWYKLYNTDYGNCYVHAQSMLDALVVAEKVIKEKRKADGLDDYQFEITNVELVARCADILE